MAPGTQRMRVIGSELEHDVWPTVGVSLCGIRSSSWITQKGQRRCNKCTAHHTALEATALVANVVTSMALSDEQYETLSALKLAWPRGLPLTGSSPGVLKWMTDNRLAVQRPEAGGKRWVITQAGREVQKAERI